ncbi:MAG: hypothetical protein A3F09_01895 [Chlamydiae bacterium RIFCSPHIGHO2_12_FULL_49_11]|nr:MAG: hypothetical protein A3F09_01895 [Chlamydiae bacterium RIFCSPHIGHO2_12_FULL_49_11]
MKNSAVFLISNHANLLDHLCPFAHESDLTLYYIVEDLLPLLLKYYPMVHHEHRVFLEILALRNEYDTWISSHSRFKDIVKPFFPLYGLQLPKFTYLCHGQSDKWSEKEGPLHRNRPDVSIVYGPLEKQRLSPHHPTIEERGNFRRRFYEKFRSFYDGLVEKEIVPFLDPTKPVLLYAPTWNDKNLGSSFFDHAMQVIEDLKDAFQLIVKPHPRLILDNYSLWLKLELEAEKTGHFFFCSAFPAIYPLLNIVDVYLGDYSSIGYDFLSFQRPLFFLKTKTYRPLKLHKTGHVIESPKEILEGAFADRKKEISNLYTETFGENPIDNRPGKVQNGCHVAHLG